MNRNGYFILAESSIADKSHPMWKKIIQRRPELEGKKIKSLKHFCEFTSICIKGGGGGRLAIRAQLKVSPTLANENKDLAKLLKFYFFIISFLERSSHQIISSPIFLCYIFVFLIDNKNIFFSPVQSKALVFNRLK